MTSFQLQTQMYSSNRNYVFNVFELTNNSILIYHIITLAELLQSEQHIKKVNFKSYQSKSF